MPARDVNDFLRTEMRTQEETTEDILEREEKRRMHIAACLLQRTVRSIRSAVRLVAAAPTICATTAGKTLPRGSPSGEVDRKTSIRGGTGTSHGEPQDAGQRRPLAHQGTGEVPSSLHLQLARHKEVLSETAEKFARRGKKMEDYRRSIVSIRGLQNRLSIADLGDPLTEETVSKLWTTLPLARTEAELYHAKQMEELEAKALGIDALSFV